MASAILRTIRPENYTIVDVRAEELVQVRLIAEMKEVA
jgi:hypothetical protein